MDGRQIAVLNKPGYGFGTLYGAPLKAMVAGEVPVTAQEAPSYRATVREAWDGIREVAPSAPGVPVMAAPLPPSTAEVEHAAGVLVAAARGAGVIPVGGVGFSTQGTF
jgi:hypothetical protein